MRGVSTTAFSAPTNEPEPCTEPLFVDLVVIEAEFLRQIYLALK